MPRTQQPGPIVCRPLGECPLAEIPGVPATIAERLAKLGVRTLTQLDLVADKVRAKNPEFYGSGSGVANGLVYQAMRSLGIEGPQMLDAGDAIIDHLHVQPGKPTACEAGNRSTDPKPEKTMTPNTKPRELPTASLTLHDQVNLVPPMPPDQFEAFVRDVKKRGIEKPIELIPGTKTIIDGRSRWFAAEKAGLASVPVVDAVFAEDESPVAYMLRVAIRRRQLTKSQLAAVAVELEKVYARDAKERKKAAAKAAAQKPAPIPATVPESPPAARKRGVEAREQAAAAVGVSPRTVSTAKQVAKQAPEAFEQVKAGTMKLSQAAKIAAGDVAPKPSKPAADPTDPTPQIRATVTGGPINLSPCPFCGSDELRVAIGTYRLVQCQKCWATGPRHQLGEDAECRHSWNKRA